MQTYVVNGMNEIKNIYCDSSNNITKQTKYNYKTLNYYKRKQKVLYDALRLLSQHEVVTLKK